jgi:hypothetical protein
MTSNRTNEEIKKILDANIDKFTQVKLFKELSSVDGNKSFKDSISNLLKLVTNG